MNYQDESPTLKLLQSNKVDALRNLYNQLPDGSKNKFDRMFPDIAVLDDSTYNHAVKLCEMTIAKNLTP